MITILRAALLRPNVTQDSFVPNSTSKTPALWLYLYAIRILQLDPEQSLGYRKQQVVTPHWLVSICEKNKIII